MAESAVLLKSVDDRHRLKLEDDRLLLFTGLLEANEAGDATQRAVQWFKGRGNENLALGLLDMLMDAGKRDLAMELAREVGRPGDAVSLTVAELMLDNERTIQAREFLAGWLKRARMTDPEVVGRFIQVALDAESPMLAYRGATRAGLANVSQEELVALAEALSATDQREAFLTVLPQIDPAFIAQNPLLAAAVEVEQGKPEPARQLLSRVEVGALDDWRFQLWSRLMTSTGRRATAEQTLREIEAGADRLRSTQGGNRTTAATGIVVAPGLPQPAAAPVNVEPVVRPIVSDPPAAAPAQAANPARPKAVRKIIRKRRSYSRSRQRSTRRRHPTARKTSPPSTPPAPIFKSVPFPAPG
ncbi:MAG: hypothetical protein ACK5JT_18560 [Hyphomicrobiaceae bacterium]